MDLPHTLEALLLQEGTYEVILVTAAVMIGLAQLQNPLDSSMVAAITSSRH
jgi:hypothetical protein